MSVFDCPEPKTQIPVSTLYIHSGTFCPWTASTVCRCL